MPGRGTLPPLTFLRNLPRQGDGCVTWPYARDRIDGYAKVYFRGRMHNAGRVVCELFHGPAPDETMQGAHNCGKAHLGCVSPWHLSWKTPKENCADRRVHGTQQMGETHPTAKLSAQDVKDIRVLAKSIVQRDIAAFYGIAQQHVSDIVRGKRWQNSLQF